MTSNLALLSTLDDKLRSCDEVCLRIDSSTNIEEATNRVFVVSHKFILSDLKKLAHSFGFSTIRYDRVIKCNRDIRHG